MNVWAEFWRLWLIVSGFTFAGITVVVAFKGLADLRAMFRDLTLEKGARDSGRSERY
ncbi:MAG: hypothetical protein JOZ33_08420 [Acidobacteriaceae bacterium]|nr:hypothetical protein [Acidobacteriaceae bacterium]